MSEEDRQWFLNELKEQAKKSGKHVNTFGKAEYEQRLKDESENSFSPKPRKDQDAQLLPESKDKHELSDTERAKYYGRSGNENIGDRDYEGAIEDLSEAIRLDPHNELYYSLRGVAYYETGRHKEAIEDESISIGICPTYNTLYNRAESYYKTGRDREALDDLDRALELATNNPEGYFLIPECHKLISIIKDTSLNREDYYQAPIGWENIGHNKKSLKPHHEELDDVGPEVLAFVYTSMRIDDEWSIRAPRRFAWWGHQLAQRVWVDDCREDLGEDVTLMRVETDFLRNVKNSEQTYEALNDLNAGASQFAFIYDIKEQCIRLHSTVYTHRQSLDWSKRLFLRTVALQVSSAHTLVEKISHLFAGSEPDRSPHPASGFRPEKDELVDLIGNFYIPMGEMEPPLESDTFKFTEHNLQSRFMVTTGGHALTVEFPFTGNEPVSVRLTLGLPGVVTSLLRVNSEEGHPLLGRGLMMRMMLPVSCDRNAGLHIAMTLNLMEVAGWTRCHLNGAWYVDEHSNLVFVSFFPMAGFKSWELVNLAYSFAVRSAWAGQVMAEAQTEHAGRATRITH
jgi:tetratricopeptide (TPR) repeat protein